MGRVETIKTFANTPEEVHALLHGVYVGVHNDPRRPEEEDSKVERHYWRVGYLAGQTLRMLMIGYLVRKVYKYGRHRERHDGR